MIQEQEQVPKHTSLVADARHGTRNLILRHVLGDMELADTNEAPASSSVRQAEIDSTGVRRSFLRTGGFKTFGEARV